MRTKSAKRIEQEEQQELERERKEDMFDKARMYKMLEFITACMTYKELTYKFFSRDFEFKITLLEDGEYEISQETTESIDYSYSTKPCITSDCNSLIYDTMMELLLSEIQSVQYKLDEINRINLLKQNALSKLTPEEKKVLGL